MKTLTNNQTLEMTPYPQSLFLQQWRVTFYVLRFSKQDLEFQM